MNEPADWEPSARQQAIYVLAQKEANERAAEAEAQEARAARREWKVAITSGLIATLAGILLGPLFAWIGSYFH